MRPRDSGHITGLLSAEVLGCVIFIEGPTVGGSQSTTMAVLANGDLKLADVTFGFS